MHITNNKILITGGASGIGLALTERFAGADNTVIVCGRRSASLDELNRKLPGVITRQCDLESEAERVALYEWIATEHNDLNVLINNAGIQNWMNIEDDEFYERSKQEISINILAPVHLTKLFLKLPNLKTIINVTSGLAFVPLSKVPVYSATKAFFRSLTLSLRHQLQGKGTEVIEILPPKLNTDLGGKGLHDDAPPVAEFLDSVFRQLEAGAVEVTYLLSEQQAINNWRAIEKQFHVLNP